MLIVLFIIAYLIGSIPFGIIWAKMLGISDLRKTGSGNIGATNALRAGGKTLGILTLSSDILKGFVPLILAYLLLNPEDYSTYLYYIGATAICGHIFPIWLKFKGGKGLATFLGTILAIYPSLFLIMIFIWILVYLIFRISSISAILMLILSCIVSFVFYADSFPYICFATILIFTTHRDNISRLLKGKEKTLS